MTTPTGYASRPLLDPNASATVHAAWSWAAQGRIDEMEQCIAKLPRERVLDALGAAYLLAEALAERHTLLTERALAELDLAMVASAVLSPDDPILTGGEG